MATAKRMLVLFESDKKTCILGTKLVTRVVDGSNQLVEGAMVMVDYEGKEFEAIILKLHGKCSCKILHTGKTKRLR